MSELSSEIRSILDRWLAHNARTAWRPVVGPYDPDSDKSSFSGVPYLGDDEWPICSNCGKQMQLFVQIDLSTLPQEVGKRYGNGLIQLFFCTNDKDECFIADLADPSSTCHVVRLVDPEGRPCKRVRKAPKKQFPARCILSWKKFCDYPCTREFPNLGLFEIWRGSQLSPKLYFRSFDEEIVLPDHEAYFDFMNGKCSKGDKLAGWACWEQNVSYRPCPICNGVMDVVVFQMDSGDNLPYVFGDGGRGHIVQCPDHKDQLAFVWDCG